MLGLASSCVHPESQKPYIRSAMGGKNNSKEGNQVCAHAFSSSFVHDKTLIRSHQGESTHGFVMWFDSEKDRDYYIEEDPVHQAFVKSITPILQAVRVVDFETGVF